MFDGRAVITFGDFESVQHHLHLRPHELGVALPLIAKVHAKLKIIDHVHQVATFGRGQRRLEEVEEGSVDAAGIKHLRTDLLVLRVRGVA